MAFRRKVENISLAPDRYWQAHTNLSFAANPSAEVKCLAEVNRKYDI
jgi:hypothetical protein